MPGCSSALKTSSPAKLAEKKLMMLRGMVLPSGSLRWPVSMTWEIKVLISIRSPGLAASGSLMRGLFIAAPLCALTAAAADRDLYGAPTDQKLTVAQLGEADHLLGAGEAHAGCRRGLARQRAEAEGGNARLGVLGGDYVDRLDVVGGRHRALDRHRERHGVAVLGDFRQLQADLALKRFDVADQALQGLLPGGLGGLCAEALRRGRHQGQRAGAGCERSAIDQRGCLCVFHLTSQLCPRPTLPPANS